ncbi:PREDICTED: DNA helicase B [Myotis davidii]|uniref:DNA helicase B n=1 Tax=Myotis davidii TaxID=225400 RepID=L5LIM2_MYODS|nr:PREDICTED: DNA helicase B [Myotis davidii]ELK25756.1 DNA helicase B [Myotis davidii]
MASRNKQLRELQGQLLPSKALEEVNEDCLEEEDDDCLAEEEDEPVFVDAEELCCGGLKAGSLPGCLPVVISDENTRKKYEVSGHFPLTGPWWRVKVQVKPAGSRNYQVQGFPSYFLQSDMSPPDQENICSLFLTDCNVHSDTITKFLAWVNATLGYENLNFENLWETLRTFEKENMKNGKKQSTQQESQPDNKMWRSVEKTIPFKSVMTALKFPKIMEFIPVLLPRHFKQLISSCPNEVLENMEEILGTHPWKLGFSKVTYRELKLLQCEASWTAFCQCPSLLLLMTDVQKNGLIVYSKLKQLCREHGHTYVEEPDLTSQLSNQMSFHDVWECLKFLNDIHVVTYKKGCVFLYNLYQAEKGIASSIGDLMKRPPWCFHVDVKKVLASIRTKKPENSRRGDPLNESKPDETLETSEANTQDSGDHICDHGEDEGNAEIPDDQLDQDQVAALEMVCSNAVTVISGKGGCGKTTIVSHLFRHRELLEKREVEKACEDFEQDQDVPEEWLTFTEQSLPKADKGIEVLLTAPTGKAAGLLRQRTGFHAYTLCQVNYSFYFWKKTMDKENSENNSPWRFSSVRVLVVDEGSLVSVVIFKSVLNLLLEHSNLSKLIILGDIRQLPSIEPGNLLQDLFDTLKSRNCAIELKTNHRTESELIVDNATRISKRQFPKFDAELSISVDPTIPVSVQDKTFIFVRLPEEDASSQSSKSNHHSHLYSAVETLLKEKDLESAETSQFIAFRRQDCDVINDCCCKHYTGLRHKDHKNRFIFGVGHKICCTRNAYLLDLLPENSFNSQKSNELEDGMPYGVAKNKHDFESGIRLCNGEIFFIRKDITDVTLGKRRYLTIDNMAGLEVTVDFKKLMKFCRIRHAWARTIHTFQGSEEQTVVYAVGKAGRQDWQHVYTAVTRGRRRVYVIAEEAHLRSAISRNNVRRKTRLKHFLQDQLSSSSASPAEGASPAKGPEDGRGASTLLPASLFPAAAADSVTDDGQASAAAFEAFACPGGWRGPFPGETNAGEDPFQPRGSKRTCAMAEESPSKVLMMEESSPQVSSRLQNLKLNNLTPRQLFKPTDNQET